MLVYYSTDLQWRAVWLVTLHGMTYEVNKVLFISEKSVGRYVDHFSSTGKVDPEKQRHGPECLLSEFEQTTVLQAMIDNTSVYLIELQNKRFDTTGTWVHESTIRRTVHKKKASIYCIWSQ